MKRSRTKRATRALLAAIKRHPLLAYYLGVGNEHTCNVTLEDYRSMTSPVGHSYFGSDPYRIED